MTDSTPPNEDSQADAAPKSAPASAPAAKAARASSPEIAADAPPSDPLVEARAESARLKEQWMRTAADFDNFRKRARRDVDEARRGGREELLKDLLPVFDNLERAIQSAQRATEVKPVAEGLTMVVKQFVDVVGRAGITKVPTVGSSFDPTIHEAIQQVETDEHAPGTVVSEVQPGYMQGERLVRAAMVVVAKAKTGEAPAAS
jgi:molecular chaperone GrpE